MEMEATQMINNVFNKHENRNHSYRLSNIEKPTNYSFIRDNMGHFDFLKKDDTIPKRLNNVESLSEKVEIELRKNKRQ